MTVSFRQIICLLAGVSLLALGGGLMGGRLAASANRAEATKPPRDAVAMPAPVVTPAEPKEAEATPAEPPAEPVVPQPVPAKASPPPVKPSVSAPPPAAAAPAATPSAFVVQAMATPSRAEARKARQQMMEAGFPTGIFEADLGPRGTWYRIYIGPYESDQEAGRVLDAVRATAGFEQSFVRPLE